MPQLPQASTSQIPHGVGLPPPPGMDPKKGKLMCIKVRMLDDTTAVFHLGHKATGQALFDEVCRHLNLLESDYFGLEFIDGYGNKVWLDKEKSILRQITSTQSDARFYFIVKFYTPNPADLEEEYTRYLISLQIRRDLAQGEFVCNENTAALLVAYIVQADCGDFSHDDYPDHTYLSPINFIPHQTVAFQIKVMENHKQLIGMTPEEADFALLEVARRCDFYGIKLHIAKDIEGTDVNLSVAHMGIKVFHQLQCVSVFSWAKIRKLSFKRKKLMIKLHPESNPYYKETVEFSFDTRNECKNFWKKSVEHHAFFRCLDLPEPKREHKLFSRGSSFRYHGRTQKQLIDYVREHHKRREPFSRPIRPSNSRSGSTQRHMQFNVIDATTGSLTRKAQPSGFINEDNKNLINNGNNHNYPQQFNPVYYPPGYNQSTIPTTTTTKKNEQKQRPKSSYNQHHVNSNYSDNERNCISDLESNSKDYYIQQKNFNNQLKNEVIDESVQTSTYNDPMSQSLPNVLGDDIKIICREFELNCNHQQKSASGDNFLEQVNNPNAQFDYYLDNISEGSYKLHDPEHQSSSQSDILTNNNDPRIYNTTFTTKRIGNIIVKKVSEQKSKNDSEESSSDYSKNKTYSKYAQVMKQSMAAGGMARFKDAVPIPIDGPGTDSTTNPTTITSTSSSTTTNATTAIIKPVVLSPIQNKSFFDQEKHAKIQQIPMMAGTSNQQSPVSSDEPKYSAVHRIRQIPGKQSNLSTFSPSPSMDTGFKSIAASSRSSEEKKRNSAEKEGSEDSKGVPVTYGATGPIKGKIIHKENIVITPEGITVREAIMKKDKPVVPPKPKNIPSTSAPMVNIDDSKPKNSAPPVPTKPKIIPTQESENREFRKLLEPLDSILKDAEELKILSEGKKPTAFPTEKSQQKSENEPSTSDAVSSSKHDKITVISVESDDRPDLKKVHLLNGEIPYTLTMRNLDSNIQNQSNTCNNIENNQSSSDVKASSEDTKRNVDINKHRKTLDLVHRKRLPSQDSFSSQDHSISPTTPDTGNVVDYVMRRRSVSSDRNPKKGRRGDPRRKTQPVVRFNDKPTTAITATTFESSSESTDISKAPVVKPETDEDNDLPDPPPIVNSPIPSSSSMNETEKIKSVDESNSKISDENNEPTTSKTETGLLWTDF